MKTHYDKQADALYIHFENGKKRVFKTIKMKDFFFIDIDRKEKVYGIEILDASRHLPLKSFGFPRKRTKRVKKKK